MSSSKEKMLQSPSSKGTAQDEEVNSDNSRMTSRSRQVNQKIPRRLARIDPTLPLEGTRPTYFTALSTRSNQSIKALARKPFLDNYMTLRVNPSKLVVLDYAAESRHECLLTIHNYSKKAQYLSLGNTGTKMFKLSKDSPMQEFSIAPGLDKTIKVIFEAPSSTLPSAKNNHSDPMSKLYLDRLEIQVRDGKSITVPMEAYPSASRLEFPSLLDFGTLQLNSEVLSEWELVKNERFTAKALKDGLSTRKNQIKGGWITKKVPLTNMGSRTAKFSFDFDHYLPLRISPMNGTLPGYSSQYFTIGYLPIAIGDFSQKIKIILENNVPDPNERMNSVKPTFSVSGTVIDRKLKMTTPQGINILGLSAIDFGSIYFGESVYLPVTIENQDSQKHTWSLSQSRKIGANIPLILKKKSWTHLDVMEETPFSIIPSDGNLDPGQSTIIKFIFYPKTPPQMDHFKSQNHPPHSKSFKLSLQLQIVAHGLIKTPDAPVQFSLKGKAEPFLVNLSSYALSFPRNNELAVQHSKIVMKNLSKHLGASFKFKKVAHFDLEPESGEIKAEDSLDIKVTFRPNQYGHFQIVSKCDISPLIPSTPGSMASELKLGLDNRISNMQLVLCGSWLPGALPKNIERFGLSLSLVNLMIVDEKVTDTPEKPSLIEWKKKVAHRQRYIDYIRGDGAIRPRTQEKIPSISQNIQVLEYLDEERLRSNVCDSRTGLIPPEPIGLSRKAQLLLQDENQKEQKEHMMEPFFEKLAEPFRKHPKPFNEIGLPPLWHEASLSQKDLLNVFASTAVLDFGQITVHSRKTLPLNFLNAAISKSPVHISHSFGGQSKLLDVSCVRVSPSHLNIAHLEIAGFEVSFSADVPGLFSANLNYIVNKRYVHQVKVKADIVPVDLNSSAKSVSLNLTEADLIPKLKLKKKVRENAIPDQYLESEMAPEINESNYITRVVDGKEFKFPTAESTFKISNPGNFKAYFEIESLHATHLKPEQELLTTHLVDGAFQIDPISSFVEAFSKENITVRFVPGTKVNTEHSFVINVYDYYNGVKTFVKKIDFNAMGSVAASDCQLLLNTKLGPLDFGLIPYFSKEDPKELYDMSITPFSKYYLSKFPFLGVKTIKIKNDGTSCAFVAFSSKHNTDIDIRPNHGIIKEDQTLDLVVTINSSNSGITDDEIIVNLIGGGKGFRIPIRYETKRPHVEFVSLESIFADYVIVHSMSAQSYNIFNKGQVFGRLVFDLTEYPDFSIDAKEDLIRGGYSHEKAMAIVPHRVGRLNGKRVFVVDSQPGDRFKIDLLYSPKIVKTINTKFTAYTLGNKSHRFECHTKTTALQCPIKPVDKEINFGEKVIHPETRGAIPETKEFTVQNISKLPVDWNCEVDMPPNYEHAVFSVSPKLGTIQPGSNQVITISYQPISTGSFHGVARLQVIYLDFESFFPVNLKGSAMHPAMLFDPPEVFMPIVPCGVQSTALLWLTNAGCDSGDIIVEIPPEIKRSDIAFEMYFPEGRFLKDDGDRIPCLVKFQAKKPISFTIRVPFQDPEFSKYYLTVHGTSDSSYLTLLPYSLNTPIQLNYKMHLARKDFQTPSGVICSGHDKFSKAEALWNSTFALISFWLNENLGSNTSNFQFPESLILSSGTPVFSLIQSLAGKKVSILTSKGGTEENGKQTIRHYNELLTHLKMHGALLSTVKAEFLLSLDEFRKIADTFKPRAIKKAGKETHSTFAHDLVQNFNLISREAWCTLLLQIIRIYLFPPHNPNIIKSLRENQQNEVIENLNGAAQSTDNILLSWVTFNYRKFTGSDHVFSNFGTDFNNSLAYAALLRQHIPSVSKCFHNFHFNAAMDDHLYTNALEVKNALVFIFGEHPWQNFDPKRIYRGTELDHQFLILFLFEVLPQFIPTGTIEFSGELHTKHGQSIELTNSSTKAISYIAKLHGATEFSMDEFVFTIPPMSNYNFKVEYTGRFARRSEAILTIQSKRCTLSSFNILSFKLSASPSKLQPIKTFNAESSVYAIPATLIKIDVKNIFPQNANFKVQIFQTTMKPAVESTASFLNQSNEENSKFPLPNSFTPKVDAVSVKANQSEEIQIQFLPFEIGDHYCTVLFHDPEVGEFMYEIQGRAIAPHPCDQTTFTGTSGIVLEKTLRLTSFNTLRDKALHLYSNSILPSKIVNNAKAQKEKSRSHAEGRDMYQLPKRPLRYSVEYSSPYFRGPTEIVLKSASDLKEKTTLTQHFYNDLPITFSPKSPGKYVCKVTLSCVDLTDYRVILVNGLARAEGSKAEMDFTCQAKHSVTQEIPIINQTDEDWPIRASLHAENFATPFMIVARANATTNYPIVFHPRKKSEVNGVLQLTNSYTNQRHVYNLRGIGLDPEPESVFNLNCVAREKLKLQFNVKNDLNVESVFNVVTDLQVFTGEKSIVLGSDSSTTYTMEITPLHSGRFSKYVKFVNSVDESFSWFSIQLSITPAAPDYTIELEATVRQVARGEISLRNPKSKEILEYKVDIIGTSIKGESSIKILPGGDYIYRFEYSPLVPGKSFGIIRFIHPTYGEFSYQLKLHALNAPPIVLDQINCPLGKYKSVLVELYNPLQTELIFDATISNPRNFQVFIPPVNEFQIPVRTQETTKKVLVEPFQTIVGQIIFWPSSLTEKFENHLAFTNPSLGTVSYSMIGRGLEPVEMNPIVISCTVGDSKGGAIEFENPFFNTVSLEISLQSDDDDGAFSMINAPAKAKLCGSLETTTIQVNYEAKSMKQSNASLVIEVNQRYRWVYPLRGVPEIHGQAIQLRSRVREKTESIQEIQFTSLSDAQLEKDTKGNLASLFKMELGDGSHDVKLEKCLSVKVLEANPAENNSLTMKIQFQFFPWKLMESKTHVKFIHIATGSAWKFPIIMLGTNPPIDDTIIIQGAAKKETVVSFNLKNPIDQALKFKAYFIRKGHSELSIRPEEGVLVPMKSQTDQDNQFFISFAPESNGKSCNASMVIETDEYSLFYDVKAITPIVKRK